MKAFVLTQIALLVVQFSFFGVAIVTGMRGSRLSRARAWGEAAEEHHRSFRFAMIAVVLGCVVVLVGVLGKALTQ